MRTFKRPAALLPKLNSRCPLCLYHRVPFVSLSYREYTNVQIVQPITKKWASKNPKLTFGCLYMRSCPRICGPIVIWTKLYEMLLMILANPFFQGFNPYSYQLDCIATSFDTRFLTFPRQNGGSYSISMNRIDLVDLRSERCRQRNDG